MQRATRSKSGSFNGATARTRWNAPLPGRRSRLVLRASMGPPRERGGTVRYSSTAASVFRLQWGHRANAVERVSDSLEWREVVTGLQWGHRANAVERRPSRSAGAGRRRLQWGHRANAVERLPPLAVRSAGLEASMGPPRERGGTSAGRCSLAPDRRFNGATARTRWNGGSGGNRHHTTDPASMGPPRERGGTT